MKLYITFEIVKIRDLILLYVLNFCALYFYFYFHYAYNCYNHPNVLLIEVFFSLMSLHIVLYYSKYSDILNMAL